MRTGQLKRAGAGIENPHFLYHVFFFRYVDMYCCREGLLRA